MRAANSEVTDGVNQLLNRSLLKQRSIQLQGIELSCKANSMQPRDSSDALDAKNDAWEARIDALEASHPLWKSSQAGMFCFSLCI
ncbi:hypothetical protein ICHIJ1_17980 [Fluviibacter phosphoraccumulans]|uniref:hypothetical protein n=1 Tax=Fluviibacter phosphoraccumulans TaxID=1751046 RepID=UPI001366AD94|nr:hypothetical protein [Fluviibacter phosphoraccumulans]BBU71879.1 hypothetical protein ICHIJ1_17980 [Fluviibacter phosphoraccumulans]